MLFKGLAGSLLKAVLSLLLTLLELQFNIHKIEVYAPLYLHSDIFLFVIQQPLILKNAVALLPPLDFVVALF